MTYNVWCPAHGETSKGGIIISADTGTEAALRYAKRHAEYREKPFKEVTVHLYAEAEPQKVFACIVEVTSDPELQFEAGPLLPANVTLELTRDELDNIIEALGEREWLLDVYLGRESLFCATCGKTSKEESAYGIRIPEEHAPGCIYKAFLERLRKL